MYEEILTEARRTTDAALRESQERVDLAVSRSRDADKKAVEGTKAVGDRWTSRINAMRRRAFDRTGVGGRKGTEMSFGQDDGQHAQGGDELVSLTDPPVPAPGQPRHGAPATAEPAGAPTEAVTQGRHGSGPGQGRPSNTYVAAIGNPAEDEPDQARDDRAWPTAPQRRQPPPRRARPAHDEDDDYSGQSWLQDG